MGEYAAIPTVYKGLRFRSRLEARWAAFFDACDWRWTYETVDLNRYIPDFVILGRLGPVLVEVKPAYTLEDLHEHRRKIERSQWTHESVIVGIAPLYDDRWAQPILGLMQDTTDLWEDAPRENWAPALLGLCSGHMGLGFCHALLGCHCRICDGGTTDSALPPPERHVEQAWSAACNAVQWSPRA